MSLFAKLYGHLPSSKREVAVLQESIEKLYARIERADSGINGNIDFKRDEFLLQCNQLYSRIEQADTGINGNIDAKRQEFVNYVMPVVREICDFQYAKAEHDKQRFSIYMKQCFPQDTPAESRRRLFKMLPDAEGDIRLMQLANAKLMHELDRICTQEKLPYWLSYGSLVGTLSRDGFIPWDDDIDICMMRSDVAKLISACKHNADYQITVVYDYYAKCKQIRFSSRNPDIPCFIDVSIYDWCLSCDERSDDLLRSFRLQFMDECESLIPELDYWKSNPYLFAPGSGYVPQCAEVNPEKQDPHLAQLAIDAIESIFDKYYESASKAGIFSVSKMDATGVAYSIENVYDAPWRRIIWSKDMIYPVTKHAFESYEFCVPNQADEVADECYPGWPYLPKDILGHEHFSKELLKRDSVRHALSSFVGFQDK